MKNNFMINIVIYNGEIYFFQPMQHYRTKWVSLDLEIWGIRWQKILWKMWVYKEMNFFITYN